MTSTKRNYLRCLAHVLPSTLATPHTLGHLLLFTLGSEFISTESIRLLSGLYEGKNREDDLGCLDCEYQFVTLVDHTLTIAFSCPRQSGSLRYSTSRPKQLALLHIFRTNLKSWTGAER